MEQTPTRFVDSETKESLPIFKGRFCLPYFRVLTYIHYLSIKKIPMEKAWEGGCQHNILHYSSSDSSRPYIAQLLHSNEFFIHMHQIH